MGFFKNLFKRPQNIFKTVVKTVSNPAAFSTFIATGGLSALAPKTFAPLTRAIQGTLYNPKLALAVLTRGSSLGAGSNLGGSPMSLNLGQLLGSVGGVLGSLQGANAGGLRTLGNFTSLVGSAIPVARRSPSMPSGPGGQGNQRVPMLGSSVGVIGRSFFNKYPNLATGLQRLRNAFGKKVTRSKLYSLMKTYGPAFLINAGILTAAAISELAMAGPGRRRMNPANVHALRRSLRRLESFHHLCSKVDRLRRPRSRSKSKSGSSSTFVRQG